MTARCNRAALLPDPRAPSCRRPSDFSVKYCDRLRIDGRPCGLANSGVEWVRVRQRTDAAPTMAQTATSTSSFWSTLWSRKTRQSVSRKVRGSRACPYTLAALTTNAASVRIVSRHSNRESPMKQQRIIRSAEEDRARPIPHHTGLNQASEHDGQRIGCGGMHPVSLSPG